MNENTRKSELGGFIQTRGGNFSPEPEIKRHKLDPCPDYDCSTRNCQFYHDFYDRRRDPEKYEYQPKPCRYVESYGTWGDPRGCRKRDSCEFCHTANELQHHPKQVFKETPRKQEEDVRRGNETIGMEIQRLEEEEARLIRDIEEMKKANLCAMCEGANFAVVYVPCYHPMCFMCNYKTNSRCLKCGSLIEEIHKKPVTKPV